MCALAVQIRKGVPIYDQNVLLKALGIKVLTWPQKCVSAACEACVCSMIVHMRPRACARLQGLPGRAHPLHPPVGPECRLVGVPPLGAVQGDRFRPGRARQARGRCAWCGQPVAVDAFRPHVSGSSASGPKVRDAKTINDARTFYNIKAPGYVDLFKAGRSAGSSRGTRGPAR